MEIDMQEYLKNRGQFSVGELAKFAGRWVAWSPDGMRIVASSQDLDSLDAMIQATGEDPEQCPIEGIPDTDSVIEGLNSP